MNRRIDGIDEIKGLLILLVVIDHTVGFDTFSPIIETLILSVFLNGFFFVSGFLLYGRIDENYTIGIINKLRSTFIPYIVFSVITIIWHIIICVVFNNRYVSQTYFGWELIKRDLFCMFSGIGIGTLWFLPILFISYTIVLIVMAFIGAKKHNVWKILIASIVVTLLVVDRFLGSLSFDITSLVGKVMSAYSLTLSRLCYGTGFTFIGYYFGELWTTTLSEKKAKMIFTSVCITVGCVTLFMLGDGSSFLRYVFMEVFVTLAICSSILIISEKVTIPPPLLFCGRHSLEIMIYHYLIFYPVEIAIFGKGWLFFLVNIFTTITVITALKNQKWHRRILGYKRSS